jgi:uncharacterized protein (DUF983 family)
MMNLKVTRGQIMARGLANRCPNCGARSLFKEGTLFEVNPACGECGLKIERDEGGFLGALSLNYGVTLIVFILPVMLLAIFGAFSFRTASIVGGIGAIGFPALLYRSSRSWWLMNYYLVLPRHLPANLPPVAKGEDENI